MTASDIPRLRDILIKEGIVTTDQIKVAVKNQEKFGGHLLETLIHLGFLEIQDYERVIANLPDVVSLDLKQISVFDDTVSCLPESLAVKHRVFPVDKLGPLLTLGMAIPIDTAAVEEIESVTGLRVKPVYCNPSDIDSAIYEYYQRDRIEISESKNSSSKNRDKRLKTVSTILQYIDDMPALPETVRAVRNALDDPEVELEDIEAVINRDPLASAKILALVNSAAYGLPGQVDNLGIALRMLGLEEVYNLVFSTAVLSVAEATRHFNYIRFFHSASFAAQATSRIASELRIESDASLRTAGLLHDIGEFAMAKVIPQGRERIAGELRGIDKVRREEAVLGVSHAELGFAILDHWELPSDVSEVVRNHHAPERSETRPIESKVVSLAAYLAEIHTSVANIDDELEHYELRSLAESVNLGSDHLKRIYDELVAAAESNQDNVVAI